LLIKEVKFPLYAKAVFLLVGLFIEFVLVAILNTTALLILGIDYAILPGVIWAMLMSFPLLALVKLVCDHIEPLKPWGFLLGDTMPPLINFRKIKTKLHDTS
jgi:hypothetical protein